MVAALKTVAEFEADLSGLSKQIDALALKVQERDNTWTEAEKKANDDLLAEAKRIKEIEIPAAKQRDELRRAALGTPVPGEKGAPAPTVPATPKDPADKGIEAARLWRCAVVAQRHGEAQARKIFGDEFVGKTLTAGTGSAGGVLIPDALSSEIIELLRPKTTVRSSVRQGPLPNGNVTIPTVETGTSFSYIGEEDDPDETGVTFGAVKATARKIAGIVPISNDLLRYASTAVDQLVRDDMVRGLAEAEDLAFLRGQGTGNGPKGIRYWVHANNIETQQASPTVAKVQQDLSGLMLDLMQANIMLTMPFWIMAPRTFIYLSELINTNEVLVFPEMKNGLLKGYPFKVTNQVPVTLGGGDESEVYFLDGAEFMVCDSMQLELAVSTEASYVATGGTLRSAFSRDLTLMRAIAQHDFICRRPKAGAVLTAVDWGT